jgi:hypothetical protein
MPYIMCSTAIILALNPQKNLIKFIGKLVQIQNKNNI